MKRYIFLQILPLFWIAAVPLVQGQTIEGDAVLKGLKEFLPGNWTMSEKEGKIYIERQDSIWYFYSDWKKTARNEEPDFSKGKHTVSRAIFYYEPKWDDGKTERVKTKNEEIRKKTEELAAKHGVTHLRKESRGRTIYVPQNEADKEKITQFKMEEREILSEQQGFPDFTTQNYALFKLSATGMDSKYDSVYPEAADAEMKKIFEFLEKNAR